MDTWPISRTTRDGWTHLGIPDRLGTGGLWKNEETFPTLEEVAGADWSAAILGAILPADRTWAWWTRSEVYRSTMLPTTSAPDDVNPGALDRVVARRLRLTGMTLAFVPAGDSASQKTVANWAGSDVEKVPEHLWTGPDIARWSSDAIVAWCRDTAQWSDRATVPHQPAERIVTLFDNQIFWAGPESVAAVAVAQLKELAPRWGLSIVDGPLEYAWPVLATP
jgi:hypothetical protein